MKKKLISTILVCMVISPAYLQAQDRQGQTKEYDFYLSPEQDVEAMSMEQIEAQVLKHVDFRDEAIAYYRQARNSDNKAYWFFEAMKQDALRLLTLMRLARHAHSLRPELPDPNSPRQWQKPEAKDGLNGLRRSVDYIRDLLAGAEQDTLPMDLIEMNLDNLLRAADQNSTLVEQARQADLRQRAYFQKLADEYLRIRRQFDQFIVKEALT
jgi:hypothetical protein